MALHRNLRVIRISMNERSRGSHALTEGLRDVYTFAAYPDVGYIAGLCKKVRRMNVEKISFLTV